MPEKIRLAIVGSGGIFRSAHLNGLRALKLAGREQCEIVACCDTHRESAELAAQRTRDLGLGNPRVYTDWEQMLRDRVADAVDICLPHGLHHVAGIAALESGHHVFVEKPYTVTIKTGRALAEAADRSGRVLATGVCHRRMPGQRAVKWAIESGQIGEPRMFYAHYTQWREQTPFTQLSPAMQWRQDRFMGGGANVIDSGFHFLDTIRYFFGDVERVYAELRSPTAGRSGILTDREHTVVVTFSFQSGVVGTWSWSWVVPGHETRNIVLYGTEGSIEDTGYSNGYSIYHLFMGPGELRRRDGTYLSMESLQGRFRASLSPEQFENTYPGGVTDHFAIELWDFLDAIQKRRAPEVDGWDGLKTLSLVEAIYESSLTGDAIRTEDILSGARGSAWQEEIDAHWAARQPVTAG